MKKYVIVLMGLILILGFVCARDYTQANINVMTSTDVNALANVMTYTKTGIDGKDIVFTFASKTIVKKDFDLYSDRNVLYYARISIIEIQKCQRPLTPTTNPSDCLNIIVKKIRDSVADQQLKNYNKIIAFKNLAVNPRPINLMDIINKLTKG
jgi:hypothetical protein